MNPLYLAIAPQLRRIVKFSWVFSCADLRRQWFEKAN